MPILSKAIFPVSVVNNGPIPVASLIRSMYSYWRRECRCSVAGSVYVVTPLCKFVDVLQLVMFIRLLDSLTVFGYS
jgi:hypothetical protein